LGWATVRAFEDAGWTVLRGARSEIAGEPTRQIDLERPESIAPAIEGVDLVVNTVPSELMTAESHVLQRGGILLNSSAAPVSAGQRLEAGVSDPQGSVLLNAGLAPGITNVVAAELLAHHPEADELELVLTVSMAGMKGKAGGEFAHRHLTATCRHHTAEVPLPQPFGVRKCLEFAEPERAWMTAVPGDLQIHTYLCMAERLPHEAFLAANALGAMRLLPRLAFVAGAKRPAEPTRETVTEWVGVLSGGRRIAARTVESAGDYVGTARASVILGEALLRHADDSLAPGCLFPESEFTLDELSPSLSAAGIRVVDQPVAAN
jgi:hypothetical protein